MEPLSTLEAARGTTVDTDLLDAAIDALVDAENLIAALTELKQRLEAGHIDHDAHYDIAADVLEATDRLHSFGLGIR